MSEKPALANRQVLLKPALAVGHFLGKIGRSLDQARVRLLGRTSHWADLPAVSSADVAGALETLERVGRVDLQSYLQAIEPERLMTERLGPTAVCLTLGDLDAEPLTPEGKQVQMHATGCKPCGEALRAFRLVKADVLDLTPSLSSRVIAEFPGQIEIDDMFEFDLKFRAPQGVSIVSNSVVMDGLFRNVECKPIQVIDPNLDGETLLIAKCVGPALDEIKTREVSGEIADWVTVTGQTTTGHRFSSKGLVRLTDRTKLHP